MLLTFEPYIPLALWLPMALAAAALLVAYATFSRARLPRGRWLAVILLMSLAVLMPLVILLNPTWVETLPPPPGKPLLTVLVDNSPSMAIDDVRGKSRLSQAVLIASEIEHELGQRYEVALRSFSAQSRATTAQHLEQIDEDASATDLAAALSESLQDKLTGQAVLVLSDGAHNASPVAQVRESIDQANTFGTPVFASPIGGAGGVKDLEVRLNVPQEVAFIGQETPITATIQQRGHLVDHVRLILSLEGETLSEQEVPIRADESTEVTLPVEREQKGLYRFEIRVDPIAGEATELNNAAPLALRVIDEPVQVLLLEGKPYWDTKFLVRTLSDDESIELTSVVRLTENRFLRRRIAREQGDAEDEQTKLKTPRSDESSIEPVGNKLLEDGERLGQFQVVLLGRDAEVFLTDEAVSSLRKWLSQQNGSLVCARGAPVAQVNQRLARFMPVRWSAGREHRYRVQLTKSGESLQWLSAGVSGDALENLPSLASGQLPEKPKPLAVVLATESGAEEQTTPVLTYQPVGTGRVVVVEGTGMWRWAFLPPQHQEHDETYRVFWRNLVRWLVSSVELLPSQLLALRSDKLLFQTNEPCTATLLLRDSEAKPPAILLSGGGLTDPQRIEPVPGGDAPGQYHALFGRLPDGRYQARIENADHGGASTTAVFEVRGPLQERLDVAARPDLLKMIANATGGEVLESMNIAQELGRRIDEHLAAARPHRTERTTAWDRWWVLATLIAAWTCTWILRRSSGLI